MYRPDTKPHKSIRLKGYDYSRAGAYFVTICTHNKECLFGSVMGENMVLSDFGRMVEMEFGKPQSGSLSAIVGSFKSAVAKQINLMRNTPGKEVWQRNYYEHIIRNPEELQRIREYIIHNPLK